MGRMAARRIGGGVGMKALRRSSTSPSSSASSSPRAPSSPPPWVHLRSLLAASSSSSSSSLAAAGNNNSAAAAGGVSSASFAPATYSPQSDRGGAKSPWSRRKRKRPLSWRHWSHLFSANGKLRDGGRKFLKKVRSGGVEPDIRAKVWPFLLGVYDLNSSEAERNAIKTNKRNDYEKLRRKCHHVLHSYKGSGLNVISEANCEYHSCSEELEPLNSESISTRASPSPKGLNSARCGTNGQENATEGIEEDISELTYADPYVAGSESSDSGTSDEEELDRMSVSANLEVNRDPDPKFVRSNSSKLDFFRHNKTPENFATWQRIIRLDAIRTDPEWALLSQNRAEVSREKAVQHARSVGLKDYEHLEPYMIYHAARLVAVLEAYALFDPEIGYCQGMSDLLSPIIVVMEEDHEAFWCFVGFMRKARHNFRLDEAGIRRQLKIVSQIIKRKDSHLYRHLQKLQAEDCFFVYRMVVVLFRRELTFEQTLCLWEVMWADQAAIRAGIGRSTWAKIRLHAPPTDDLLLYAIAACVLQKRKLIIERYSSMDEILRECNSMAGQLDVWRLLDDAHDLVVNLHDKI
uniref:Rab-GAP TBC domain-containing protein n=2 Tax=Leersia perrieri TaxID=77586 RepID=A0A0D9XAI0_9ORYZ